MTSPTTRRRSRPSATEAREALQRAAATAAGAGDDLLDDDPAENQAAPAANAGEGEVAERGPTIAQEPAVDEQPAVTAPAVAALPAVATTALPADTSVDVHPATPADHPPADVPPVELSPAPPVLTVPAENAVRPEAVAVQPYTPAVSDPGLNAETKYPTAVEIPPDLHAQVQSEGRSRGRNAVVRQTEVVLTAFEQLYPVIGELVAEHLNRNKVESPLFGTRTAQVAEPSRAMKRLQIRPTWGQYQALQGMATHYGLPLAVLVRLVLRRYFRQAQQRAAEARAAAAAAKAAGSAKAAAPEAERAGAPQAVGGSSRP